MELFFGISIIIWLVGLFLNLLFGFCCMSINNKKGQDALAGFLCGFFLSFIGLIICLLLPEKEGRFNKGRSRMDYGHQGKRSSMNRGSLNPQDRTGFQPAHHKQQILEAIPITNNATTINCPHCGVLLNISQRGQYSCPNCNGSFII